MSHQLSTWSHRARYWSHNWRFAAYRLLDRTLGSEGVVDMSLTIWSQGDPRVRDNVDSRSLVEPSDFRRSKQFAWVRTSGVSELFDEWLCPPVFRYALKDVFVDPLTGVPWNRDGWILAGVDAYTTNPRWSLFYRRYHQAAGRKFSSPVTVVPTSSNYYHFLVEILPRVISTLEEVPSVTVLYDENASPKWQTNLLREADIRWAPIKAELGAIWCDRYVVTTRTTLDVRKCDVRLLRSRIDLDRKLDADSDKVWNQPLFVTRIGQSRESPWDRIIGSYLSAHGWRVVEPHKLSVREQVQLFKHSPIVMGFTGAGLANTIWMRPGSTVIALDLPDRLHGFVWNRIADLVDFDLVAVEQGVLDCFDGPGEAMNSLSRCSGVKLMH